MILDALYAQVEKGSCGAFFGRLILEWRGPSDWFLLQQQPLYFIRANGERIWPENIPTDLGSIPRPFWNLPGLDPADYAKAYVIHDYMFKTHQKREGVAVDFDEANLILAEMLVAMQCPRERVTAIYEAVTLGGKAHWGS